MSFIRFIFKRIFSILLILLISSFLIFVMMRANGIDETSVIGTSKKMTAETRQELITKYNLDKPVVVRYGLWLKDALHGDFGKDYKSNMDVVSYVRQGVPTTVGLIVLTMTITLVVAVPLGILSAVKRNTWIDTVLSLITLVLTSIPDFLMGIFLIVIMVSLYPAYQFVGTYSTFGEYMARISVPSLALALSMLASIARITRSSMIEQLKSNYITAAEAKGMGRFNIVFTHAFHNSCLPVLTIISLMVGTLISGTVIVENVYSLSGLGSILVTAVQTYNYPVIQFLTLILLAFFLITSCVIEIIYRLVDPRIRN